MRRRSSLAAAQGAIADAIEEARQRGFQEALTLVEREVYSCEDIEDLLRWVRGQQIQSEKADAKSR